jgi:hypothetical protein
VTSSPAALRTPSLRNGAKRSVSEGGSRRDVCAPHNRGGSVRSARAESAQSFPRPASPDHPLPSKAGGKIALLNTRGLRAARSPGHQPLRPLGPQPHYLPDTTHRYSLGWHRSPLLQGGGPYADQPEIERPPPSGWPTPNRNQGPVSKRNWWPTSLGIRTRASAALGEGLV